MPIDTRIDGDPETIRVTADWLRNRLASGVDQAVDELHTARDGADSSWQGDAGPAFRVRMDSAGRKTDDLRVDVERAANSFHAYADGLVTAQAGMRRARGIARDGGLELAGDVILDPGPAPSVEELPASRPATPRLLQAYEQSVAAYDGHQAKVATYVTAQQEADRARQDWEAVRIIGRNVWDDLVGKALLNVGDFANGAVGGFAARHTSVMKAQAKAFLDEKKLAEERYLKARGGSTEAMRYNREAYQRYLDADKYTRQAGSVARRVSSKIPIIGLGITAAGIGYDIHQGKPAGKAVISGVVGAGAAIGVGALIGSMASGAAAGALGGPPGILIGAVAGVGASLIASGAADWAYDELLSDGVKATIDEGLTTVGNAVGNAGEAVGNAGEAVGDSAKKVWNAIF